MSISYILLLFSLLELPRTLTGNLKHQQKLTINQTPAKSDVGALGASQHVCCERRLYIHTA